MHKRVGVSELRVLMKSAGSELTQRKKVERIIRESGGSDRRLTKKHLVPLGLAIVIGAGIFNRVGESIGRYGAWASFYGLILAGVACLAAALCFAELASTVPVGGSAYTYCYASLGKFFAWVVFWMLLLQYSAGASVIALAWSHYLPVSGIIQTALCATLLIALSVAILCKLDNKNCLTAVAVFVAVAVVVKVGALLLAVIVKFGEATVHVPHPDPRGSVEVSGLLPAFTVLYFAFLGFDVISTAAEEARYPQKDLASSILIVFGLTGFVYFLVMLSSIVGGNTEGTAKLLAVAALIGLPAGVIILIYGQSRILVAVLRDLRPQSDSADSHPSKRIGTVLLSGFLATVGVILATTLLDETDLTLLVNMSTAVAFALVAIGTVVLRVRRPDLPRTFRVPGLPLVAIVSVVASVLLALGGDQAVRQAVPIGIGWIGLGVLVSLILAFWRAWPKMRTGRGDEAS
ncbi:MAG: hypothetical protein DLM60_00675 [Pseudonocardiales bacterium]|nr:MAG: hypothetical protein DLM60_00675 [Pseudonocardiales bacterium]